MGIRIRCPIIQLPLPEVLNKTTEITYEYRYTHIGMHTCTRAVQAYAHAGRLAHTRTHVHAREHV